MSDAVLDGDQLLEMLGGDIGLLRELVDTFGANWPRQLTTLSDAIRAADGSALERAAHTLKGTVGVFGARSAYARALALEQAGRSGSLDNTAGDLRRLETELHGLQAALDAFCARLAVQPGAPPPPASGSQ